MKKVNKKVITVKKKLYKVRIKALQSEKKLYEVTKVRKKVITVKNSYLTRYISLNIQTIQNPT